MCLGSEKKEEVVEKILLSHNTLVAEIMRNHRLTTTQVIPESVHNYTEMVLSYIQKIVKEMK